jgi:glycerol-3-phosphate acyltransferase PlsX
MTPDPKHTVVLDVMGSDSGPENIVAGGVNAARKVAGQYHVMLVGRRDRIDPVLASIGDLPANLSVEHADSEIPMNMSATNGVRLTDSSVAVGLDQVKAGRAVAFVSPGNTGAVMATALLRLGRVRGVSRPAITSVFPTSTGRPTVVLDVGANADCKPLHLSQFAVMGSVYASTVFNHEAPRVGLVSIGEERSKGNELILNTQQLLKNSSINFVGNIEGRDILSGTVDVAVADGFTGNVLLKFAESIQPVLVKSLHRQIQTNIFSRVAVGLMLPFLRRMKSRVYYAEYRGAPLLGVNGIVIICHGSSNAKAITRAVVVACEMASKKVTEKIRDELITNHFGKEDAARNKGQNRRDRVVCPTGTDD